MAEVKVGVIGVGGMGGQHARIFSEMPDVELFALADLNKKCLNEQAEKFGVENTFEDYHNLIQLDELDIVDICIPDELHYNPVMDTLEAGKHIFLEKPLATDLDEARKIVAASKNYNTKFMVGYLLRFDPRYIQVKKAIDNGELGEIIYLVTHRNSPYTEGPERYKSGTSLTMHVVVHDLDLIHWYLKSDIKNISAEAVSKMLVDKDMKDAASAVIKFEDDTIASINYSWVLPEKSPTLLDARLEIVGTKGTAYVGAKFHDGVMIIKNDGIHSPVLLSPEINGKLKGALYEELRAFVDCVKKDEVVPIPPEEAIKSVITANSIIDKF